MLKIGKEHVAKFLEDEGIIYNIKIYDDGNWLINFNEPWGTNDSKMRCGIFSTINNDGIEDVAFNSFKAVGLYGSDYCGHFYKFVKLLKEFDSQEKARRYFIIKYIAKNNKVNFDDDNIRTGKSKNEECNFPDGTVKFNKGVHREYFEYLESRKININGIKIFINENEKRIYFPVYENGTLIFYSGRCIVDNPLPWKKAEGKDIYPIYGLEENKRNTYCVLTEGIPDSLSVKNGVALFGTGSTEQLKKIIACNFSYVIVAMDNDIPGRRAKLKWAEWLYKHGVVVYIYNYNRIQQKDFNDMKKANVNIDLKNRIYKYNKKTKMLIKLGEIV